MIFERILGEEIERVIDDMNIDEQYSIYTEYCENGNYYDDMPYSIDCLDELLYGLAPTEIIEKYGDFDTSVDYFVDGIYGLEEWNGIDYISDVVDFIIRNENDLGSMEIADILEKYNQELIDIVYDVVTETESNDATEIYNTIIEKLMEDFEMTREEVISELEEESEDVMELIEEEMGEE